ncbi:hypothetical protein KXD93_22615 [Mucilaginibacter sp. BJC16-A38]|uniref:hypothetical protein n=1 Tax=Mucilaginibacter phenanthrenivorans TaxID=1234842 RepID=UPI002157E80B|nr:hypothetical protein [Mucilaginibacter phenanthrenivorans]MCR8560465.1 hypothetical protein [Mucilaginibacter phenanthrenivorans]
MYDTVYFLVKATIKTTHKTVHEAINEVQEKSTCTISDTGRVKICKLELMKYKLKTK